jgi:PAS domain S-box-containing protein/putative nucleotidyltransferase with HDIG domain
MLFRSKPNVSLAWLARLRIPLVAWGLYAALFLALSSRFSANVSAVAMIPVLLTAWYCGPWVAALSGVLAFPLHVVILNIGHADGLATMLRGSFGSSMLVFVGWIVGTMRELSRRARRAEERASASRLAHETVETRLHTLLRNMAEGVLQVDNADVIQFVNAKFCQMIGYSEKELLGQVAHDLLIPASDEQEAMRARNAARQAYQSDKYEIQLRRKNGEMIWVEISAAPVLDGDGEVVGSFGIQNDITQRKQHERDLERQLVELQALQALALASIRHTDEDRLIAEATRTIGDTFYPDHFGILLVDKGQHTLLPHPSYQGIVQSAYQIELPIGSGIVGIVAQTGLLMRLDDTSAVADFVETTDTTMCSELCVPLKINDEVIGVINAESTRCAAFSQADERLLTTMAGYLALGIKNARLIRDVNQSYVTIEAAYEATLKGWAHALDMRDGETAGHSQRVTDYTLQLAQVAGLKDEQLVHLRRGALLHDIGKMVIPDSVLQKPGPLDEEEWEIMKQHPRIADEMLRHIDFLQPSAVIPFAHHERWDGSGYPLGLRGREIPIEARLFAIVDVWDALRSDRPYRTAWPEAKALAYLHDMAGVHFDPYLVDLFIDMLNGNVEDLPRFPAYADLEKVGFSGTVNS